MPMLSPDEVLELIPQKPPFRFIDRLVELDESHAIGEYTFRDDEFFYKGHFPDNPVTPGVILIETMCQTGLVALGIYCTVEETDIATVRGQKILGGVMRVGKAGHSGSL